MSLFFGASAFSQIVFEEGYFIDESNQKINCQIKNVDWRNNPTKFSYRLSPNEPVETATLESIVEFGINNASRYVRAKVMLDRSSNVSRNLTEFRNPEFQEELLFLKVLIEGDASLYLFVDGSITRFFYSVQGSKISQLIHKKYLKGQNIGFNNYFRQQLYNDLNCEKKDEKDFENIRYNSEELEETIVAYNNCKGSASRKYGIKEKEDFFSLTLRPGIRTSSLSIQNSVVTSTRSTNFDSELSFQFGIETEFSLPFNKGKWSIIIEPTYQYFKSEQSITRDVSRVNYSSIEFPVGVRHYFFLTKNSKVFINCSGMIDFDLNSSIDFNSGAKLEITSTPNVAFGFGFKHNDKYGLELRYQIPRKVLNDYIAWDSDYQVVSFIFGFSIF